GGRGRTGQRPYMESICCRLQQTTSVKDGAHTAHTLDRVEDEDPIVGSIEIHTVPMGAHASNGVWTPVGLRRTHLWLAGVAKCLKRFGGPEGIRTLDLFHAMEARSQLRHRPTRLRSSVNLSTPRISLIRFGLCEI